MRIAWYSNAPWTSSGYGVQTALFAPRIKALGHDICIIANVGLEGQMLQWNGDIPVYPRGFHNGFDGGLIQAQAKQFGADIILSFYDAWVLGTHVMGPRWVPWYPVDRDPFPKAVYERVKDAFFGITCSQFGQDRAGAMGLQSMLVPCGVDTQAFAPMDKAEARAKMGVDPDVFLVGIVGDNKGFPSRKALPQQLEAFAEFAKRHEDARLYLHTCMGPQRGGVNCAEICNSLGIADKLYVADQTQYQMGMPQEYMRVCYSAMDVLSGVSMDEGFGVPLIEAQACGTPVIAGDWHSMKELVGCGWLVTDKEPWYDATGGYKYLPHVAGIVSAYGKAYNARNEDHTESAREFVMDYDADTITRYYWGPVLEEIEFRLVNSPKDMISFDDLLSKPEPVLEAA